jgi:diguanylate cyclase (GGDEF)-like protein
VPRANAVHRLEQSGAHKSASLRFIEQYLESGTRARLTGLLLAQLDAFNRISSTFGQEHSAEFCARYARQLRDALPAGTPIIRLSERRFAVLIGADTISGVIDIARRITEHEQPEMEIRGDNFLVDITVGVAVYPTHADDAPSLFRRAELALKDARERELAFDVYRPDATQQQATLWKMESDLEKAINQSLLEVHYQPKIEIATGRVSGVEALVRWRTESGRFVAPQEFIPLAERSGRIVPLSWLVFDHVAGCAEHWSGLEQPFSIAVNLAPQVLAHPAFHDRVAALRERLASAGIRLVVELTEDSLVQGDEQTIASLERLRKLDVDLAIDDFGKGYSSLSYLKQIPATEIKIDKRFVATVAVDDKDWHIVKTIVDLAHAFGMRVVAEGVDCIDGLNAVRALGCELAQGFFIARPMRVDLIKDWNGAYNRHGRLAAKGSQTLRAS